MPAPTRSFRPARLLALAAAGLAAVGVTASPASAADSPGSTSAFRLTTVSNPVSARTEVVRWDPCTTVDYRINAALGGREAKADVQAAVARLSAASGIAFRYLGSTTYVPSTRRAPLPDAPLVIAWAPRTATDVLAGSEVGHGGWRASLSPAGHYRITGGYVVVKAGAPLAAGFGAGVTRGRVLLHELGHAVGLGHIADASMIMDATVAPTSPVAAYQAGDLTGLHRVGRAAGCID